MARDEAPGDDEISASVEQMAAMSGQQPWMVARSLARLIARGFLATTGGTREEAIASLRHRYGPAVTGE